MKLARIAVFVAALAGAAVGGVYVYSRTLPTAWHVEKSRTLAARADDVHAFVGTPREWAGWMAAPEDRGSMTMTTFGPESGPGAGHTWTGPGTHGRIEIATADPATGITYTMTMEDSATPANGSIRYTVDGDRTTVTWIDQGDFGSLPFGGLFVGMMQDQLGDHFVGALAELDRLAVGHRIAREKAEAEAAEAAARSAAEAVAADPGELGELGSVPSQP